MNASNTPLHNDGSIVASSSNTAHPKHVPGCFYEGDAQFNALTLGDDGQPTRADDKYYHIDEVTVTFRSVK